MKIIIIGGNGTIGKRLVHNFKQNHEVLIGGRFKGDFIIDLENESSIEKMYKTISSIDAIICVAGEAKWGYMDNLTTKDYAIGLKSKLMGQINLVRFGKKYLHPNASITLSTGILADDPVEMTTSAAMVNGAIHSFVKAAVLEMHQNARLNVVSLGVVEDAYKKYKNYFPGHNPISMDKVISAYEKCVEGKINGEIVKIYN
ncbi:MAG: short chain dehydrogenase [Lutibacter sp.]